MERFWTFLWLDDLRRVEVLLVEPYLHPAFSNQPLALIRSFMFHGGCRQRLPRPWHIRDAKPNTTSDTIWDVKASSVAFGDWLATISQFSVSICDMVPVIEVRMPIPHLRRDWHAALGIFYLSN